MSDRYMLRNRGSDAEYIEVPKKEWIRAERRAGFQPKEIASDHPKYMSTCATGGFSSTQSSIEGKIIRDNTDGE